MTNFVAIYGIDESFLTGSSFVSFVAIDVLNVPGPQHFVLQMYFKILESLFYVFLTYAILK